VAEQVLVSKQHLKLLAKLQQKVDHSILRLYLPQNALVAEQVLVSKHLKLLAKLQQNVDHSILRLYLPQNALVAEQVSVAQQHLL
jgi:hypothetical protein